MNNLFTKLKTIVIILLLIASCIGCETLPSVQFDRTNTKNIHKVAIIGPEYSKELQVNITGDANLFYFLMGPAIIPQLMLRYATHAANKEEAIYFNDLIFDFDIEKLLREKFSEELTANTDFKIILQKDILDNPQVSDIIYKTIKTDNDYVEIASRVGADTIIDLSIFSYWIKDSGLRWDPNVILTADAKMIRAVDKTTIWQTRITDNTKRKASGLEYFLYQNNNAELLRFELKAVAEIVAKALVRNLGFEVEGDINDIRRLVSEKAMKTVEDYHNSPEYQLRNMGYNSSYNVGHNRSINNYNMRRTSLIP